MNSKVFPLRDLLWFGGFTVVSTVVSLGVTLTPGNDLLGIALTWSVCLAFWAISAIYFSTRAAALKTYLFTTPHQISVYAMSPDYEVYELEFNAEVIRVLRAMKVIYPTAEIALQGCVVVFREPTWWQNVEWYYTRKVAGVQDHMVLQVGWHKDLRQSALAHELAHRILEICAADPEEPKAHRIIETLGI